MSVVDQWFERWPEPRPAAVTEICNRLDGGLVQPCEHIDGDPAEYRGPHLIWWFARFRAELLCTTCAIPTIAAFATYNLFGVPLEATECDRCERTRLPSHRKYVPLGNVRIVIELCEACLNSDAGTPLAGRPASETSPAAKKSEEVRD